jgi:hypothetical protein
MITDGVDVSDPEAVRAWLEGAGVPWSDDDDEDIDFEEYEDFSFKEAFGLPDRLPPIRLPLDRELADAARQSPLLAQARVLGEWVGPERTLTENGELIADDCVDAARALGFDVPDAVESIGDVPELAHLWELADSVELIEFDDDRVRAGSAVQAWPDGDDEDVLDIWATALAVIMTSLDLDAELYGEEDEIEFHGAGGAMLMALFLARSSGLPYGELAELVSDLVLVNDAWVRAHGQPAEVLLGRMDALGAVALDGEVARLTPLAQWAVWSQLQDSDVEIDVLPAVEEMTAADLVAAAEGFTEEELAAEAAAWLELRTPAEAARELLEVAAGGEPADRMYATSVVAQLGPGVEVHWRRALDDQRLRPYAKLALEMEPESADLAWLLTDVLAATSEVDGPDDIAAQLSDAVPAGQEQEIFEAMWRLPHPFAGEVLTMLGAHHPDKEIAKAARKAAFKAASHHG